MKVTRAMYGRAAKCVACHQKWFVPKEGELPADTAVIHLAEHPELLRQTGVFVRSRPAPVVEYPGEEFADPAADPMPVLDDEAAPLNEPRLPGGNAEPPIASAAGSGKDENAPPSSKVSPDPQAPIRCKGKKPFDILEPLRMLCSFEQAYDILEHRMLANEEPGIDEALLGAYQRALEKARERLKDRLRKTHDSVQRQIAALEKEIDRLAVTLRVGDIDLPHFRSQVAALRSSRECLARYDHHLLAWQDVQNPFLAGGLKELSLDSFDEDSFEIELPPPPEIAGEAPLFVHYSDELRSAMRARAGIELRLEEWKRLSVERPGVSSSLETGMADTVAARERIEAAIGFFRQRMQVLLADCGHDLDSLQKYRRDVQDRDRKGQLKRHTRESLLRDIEEAESALMRVQAHIRKSLHANAETEVPLSTSTLAEQLVPHRPADLSMYALAGFALAIVLLLPALLFLSYREMDAVHRIVWVPVAFAFVLPCSLLVREKWTRTIAVLFTWTIECALIAATLLVLSRYTPIRPGRFVLPYLDILGALLALGSLFSGMAAGLVLIDRSRLSLTVKILVPAVLAVTGALVAAYFYAQAQPGAAPGSVQPATEIRGAFPPPPVPPLEENSPAVPEPAPAMPASDYPSSPTAPSSVEPSEDAAPLEEIFEGEKEDSEIPPTDTHSVSFSLVGVVHGEGVSPRFRAATLYFDGRREVLTIELGDVITGDWKAVEYNSGAKKLTISNGKRMLLLGAGDQVVIDDYVSGEGETDSP